LTFDQLEGRRWDLWRLEIGHEPPGAPLPPLRPPGVVALRSQRRLHIVSLLP